MPRFLPTSQQGCSLVVHCLSSAPSPFYVPVQFPKHACIQKDEIHNLKFPNVIIHEPVLSFSDPETFPLIYVCDVNQALLSP